MDIGKALKFYRKKANLMQGEIAERIGITKKTYGSYEDDGMNIRVDMMYKICDALNIKVVDLLNKAEEL